ncbi:DUF3429 domain-containing protein [Shimia ponticola]|uniref:DUF3429 domain-containing protein n=1 Tax=Shimia ponticola TaxID=2582893 RepID=UPI0011BDB9B9|nr:DUF3429 domain-containing protein [Shimia ponticola]
MDIPRSALLLGLAGVLPFLWGALTSIAPGLGQMALPFLGPRLIGPFVQLQYGIVILAFMSGVLWGFGTRAGGRQALCYTLSVLPALWAFFATGAGATATALSLIAGFIGLLALDWQFSRWGLTPPWWMSLRILLTALVVISLGLGTQL